MIPKTDSQLGGVCFIFTPIPGEMIQFHGHIFSNGLVQPPTRNDLRAIPWQVAAIRRNDCSRVRKLIWIRTAFGIWQG